MQWMEEGGVEIYSAVDGGRRVEIYSAVDGGRRVEIYSAVDGGRRGCEIQCSGWRKEGL